MKSKLLLWLLSLVVVTATVSAATCPPVLKRYNTTIVSMAVDGNTSLTRPIRDRSGQILVPEQLLVPIVFRIRHDATEPVSGYQLSLRYRDESMHRTIDARFVRVFPFLTDPSLPGPAFLAPGEREVRGALLLPRALAGLTATFTAKLNALQGYYPRSACGPTLRIDPENAYSARLDLSPRYR